MVAVEADGQPKYQRLMPFNDAVQVIVIRRGGQKNKYRTRLFFWSRPGLLQ
jgi:hypothetical protein